MIYKASINRLTKTVLICFAYLILTSFYYHLDKYTTGPIFILLTLCIPILFLFIVWRFIKGLIDTLRKIHSDNFSHLSLIICSLILGYTLFSPYQFSSEQLESDIELRACFEGTQNQATIKFRRDKTFELNWTGIFFSDNWFTGTYIQKGDTLALSYKGNKPLRLGHLLLNKNGELSTIKTTSDSLDYAVPFYIGYCKHLN